MLPNLDESNNILAWGEHDDDRLQVTIGAYKLNDIIIQVDDGATIYIIPNKNMVKVNVTSNRKLHFKLIIELVPYWDQTKRILEVNKLYTSLKEERILRINTICIDCNIASGAYLN